MYPEEVKITNFSEKANLHRNSNRWIVDEMVAKKDQLIDQVAKFDDQTHPHVMRIKERIAKLDYEARQIWREIVTVANAMTGEFRNKYRKS